MPGESLLNVFFFWFLFILKEECEVHLRFPSLYAHLLSEKKKKKKRLSFSTLSNPPSHESPVNLDTSARPISHFPFPFPLHPPLILNWPSACALSIAYLKLHIFFLFSSPRPADGSIAFRQIPQSRVPNIIRSWKRAPVAARPRAEFGRNVSEDNLPLPMAGRKLLWVLSVVWKAGVLMRPGSLPFLSKPIHVWMRHISGRQSWLY